MHFSKDRLFDVQEQTTIYGRVVESSQKDTLEWGRVIPGMYVRSLSQEHGIVVVPESEDFDSYQIGQLLLVLPVHSCMTADVHKKGYWTTEGERLERMLD